VHFELENRIWWSRFGIFLGNFFWSQLTGGGDVDQTHQTHYGYGSADCSSENLSLFTMQWLQKRKKTT